LPRSAAKNRRLPWKGYVFALAELLQATILSIYSHQAKPTFTRDRYRHSKWPQPSQRCSCFVFTRGSRGPAAETLRDTVRHDELTQMTRIPMSVPPRSHSRDQSSRDFEFAPSLDRPPLRHTRRNFRRKTMRMGVRCRPPIQAARAVARPGKVGWQVNDTHAWGVYSPRIQLEFAGAA
jgi:hypothetical protein